MLKIILTKGAPASGKSFWAKQVVASDPENYLRINNDDLRASFNGTNFSASHEKIITATRLFLIREGLKQNKNIIVDNVNANASHWKDCCKIAKEFGDVEVSEKIFYEELFILIERDSKREGKAQVGEDVIKKFWKALGGKQFASYSPRTEFFPKRDKNAETIVMPMVQDENLPRAVIFDNDGTISLIHSKRSPYDASTCDLDHPHLHVIECMRLYYNAGYKILFVSGREEKDRAPTERFYQKYFPEVKYELYMRPTGDKRKDVVIKEEIFNNHIKNKYFVAGWFDDRLQIVKWLFKNNFPVFRVNDPEASF